MATRTRSKEKTPQETPQAEQAQRPDWLNVNRLAAEARAEAVSRLIQRHPDEWETIQGEERTSRGLPAKPMARSASFSALMEENRKLRQRLRDAGIDA